MPRQVYAALVGRQVLPVSGAEYCQWAAQKPEKRIAFTRILAAVTVYTRFSGVIVEAASEPCHWFETWVSGGPLDLTRRRYATYDEAMAGHEAMVARVKAAIAQELEASCPA